MANETYHEKLLAVREWAEENIDSIDGFCVMFDITLEDMIKCFPDALVKKFNKVFPDGEDDGQDEEEDAWRGYSVEEE
jgi:hypothetical protein